MSDSAEFVDYYELLGVSPVAEPKENRRAFIYLAKKHHPDVGGSTAMMQQLAKAYRTLMSVPSRTAYDLMHDFHTGSTATHYRDYGRHSDAAVSDLADSEIDRFIDTIFAEYHNAPKPKKTLLSRLRQFF
jgi:curved DNA-binding protein CbpA